MMNAAEKLLTVSSTVPVMHVAPAKPGSYQAAAELDLSKLAPAEAATGGAEGGEGAPAAAAEDATPMEVEQ